ncbi:nuclear transport factor 2 family protein [Streptomyces hebeiensis]
MTANKTVTTDLYLRVQQFYARQMHAQDSGRHDDYADTFTEDGVFAFGPGLEPAVGRETIRALLTDNSVVGGDDPVQVRHWFNQLVLEPRDDGAFDSRFYALVVNTRPGSTPEFVTSAFVHDVLLIDDDGILMRSRNLSPDHLA